MKKFFVWLGTLVEDKSGAISSKRIGFFWCLFMLNRMMYVPDVNEILVYTVAFLALGLVGLSVPEWFSKMRVK